MANLSGPFLVCPSFVHLPMRSKLRYVLTRTSPFVISNGQPHQYTSWFEEYVQIWEVGHAQEKSGWDRPPLQCRNASSPLLQLPLESIHNNSVHMYLGLVYLYMAIAHDYLYPSYASDFLILLETDSAPSQAPKKFNRKGRWILFLFAVFWAEF